MSLKWGPYDIHAEWKTARGLTKRGLLDRVSGPELMRAEMQRYRREDPMGTFVALDPSGREVMRLPRRRRR